MNVFIRFERCRDGIIGPTYGPYDYVQITYSLVRAFRDNQETELASKDPQDDNWVLVDDEAEETVFSDFVVYPTKPTRPHKIKKGTKPKHKPEWGSEPAAELIRNLEQCPNPHLEKGAQLWRIGKRFRIICQFCAGCYGVDGKELAALEQRFATLGVIGSYTEHWKAVTTGPANGHTNVMDGTPFGYGGCPHPRCASARCGTFNAEPA